MVDDQSQDAGLKSSLDRWHTVKMAEESLRNMRGLDHVVALAEAPEVEVQQTQVCVCVLQQQYCQPAAAAAEWWWQRWWCPRVSMPGGCCHHEVAEAAVSTGQSTSPECEWLSSSIA